MAFLLWLRANWKLVAIGTAMLALVSFGWYVKGNIEKARSTKEFEKAVNTYIDDNKKMGEKAAKLEKELAKQRIYNRRMEGLITYEIGKNDVYSKCVVPADGVRLLNETITEDRNSR